MARHLYRCPLRWADMDMYGIINNVAYLRYLEEARRDLMAPLAIVDDENPLFRGDPVVISHTIDYKRPLIYRPRPVDVETWVSQIQTAMVTIDYQVKDGDQLCATASTVIAPFNHDAGRARRLTADERALLEKYLEASAQPEAVASRSGSGTVRK
ncbi:acyl-CoA thioesterase [Catenulispora pinisilvae]|uniref:acyl-CoA thioesterase n=1 Tax=Catenulispora pinisilvae TaxID=2705253 RepID=UPI001891BEA4|nr:thioesterase family protein [Catenulispora pinisilvae]